MKMEPIANVQHSANWHQKVDSFFVVKS